METLTFTVTTTVTVDVDAINDFISESKTGDAIVGYLPFIPPTSTINALKKLDYGCGIIVPREDYNAATTSDDDSDENDAEEIFDSIPSLVQAGGYAFDSMPNANYSDIKRVFNAIIPSSHNEHTDNIGFLVRIVVLPSGISETDSIAIDMNTGRIYNQSPTRNFTRFRTMNKASSVLSSYRAA